MPWRNAERLFQFKEPTETCLGYGDRTIHGSAIGASLRARLMLTAKQIVDLGISDPELFALLGLLEDDIGADRISDMTTHVIRPALLEFNGEVLPRLGLPLESFEYYDREYQLVRNPLEKRKPTPVLLLPRDILRELPIAHDWSDVADAAGKNEALRQQVNVRIGEIWAIRTRREKEEARRAALSSRQAFETLLSCVDLCDKVPYNAIADPHGHYSWRQWLTRGAIEFPLEIARPDEENLVRSRTHC